MHTENQKSYQIHVNRELNNSGCHVACKGHILNINKNLDKTKKQAQREVKQNAIAISGRNIYVTVNSLKKALLCFTPSE